MPKFQEWWGSMTEGLWRDMSRLMPENFSVAGRIVLWAVILMVAAAIIRHVIPFMLAGCWEFVTTGVPSILGGLRLAGRRVLRGFCETLIVLYGTQAAHDRVVRNRKVRSQHRKSLDAERQAANRRTEIQRSGHHGPVKKVTPPIQG